MCLKKLVSILMFVLVSNVYLVADALPHPFKILPQPQNITLNQGKGLKANSLQHIVLKGNFDLPSLPRNLSPLSKRTTVSNQDLVLILDANIKTVDSKEGYILTITNEGVSITAKDLAGLFYGCQSLDQLMEDAIAYNELIPACIITDYPSLTYRAVHFDVKHHLDHMNYYYESIDRLARYKINAVVFEFEDKLRYQRQPEIGAPQSISIDEMAALTQYARDRFIEITPLVQGLGHASFVLKHEKYKKFRELSWNHWAFCPLDEGTYEVLFDMYLDAIEATPGSKYLHIGGDEIGNIGLCHRCKPTADKEGIMSLNLHWLKRVCAFAKENNRIPIFWDDMPLQHAGLYKSTWSDEVSEADAKIAWSNGKAILDSLQMDFPKNCVYMRWNYSMAHQPGNVMALDWYKSKGLNAMIATATNGEGGMFFQEDDRKLEKGSNGIIAIKSYIKLAAEKGISGMLCTAWDDRSPHMENYWRGFIAAGEYSWHPDGRTLDEFDLAWAQKEFGLEMADFHTFNEQLRKGSVLNNEALFKKGNLFDDENMLQSTKQVEHWLKPMEGRELLKMDYSSKLISVPDLSQPGAWSKKYKMLLDRCKEQINQAPYISQRLDGLEANSKRNRYFWQLSKAIYKFQNTTQAILIALEKVDSPDSNDRQSGLEDLNNSFKTFEIAWSELQTTYSKTRFIEYPSNYVPDRYFHLASQSEDLTWMIQAQSLYISQLKSWMNVNK